MNRILTVYILLLGGFHSALCQTPESPSQIEYDFYKNKFIKSISYAKRNEWVQVTVKNINPYIYKINVANKDSTTSVGTPPSILKDLFDFDKLVKIAANLVSSGSVATASASSVENPSGKVKTNKEQEEKKRVEALQQCFDQQKIMENATIRYAKNIVALKTEVTQKLSKQADPLRLKLLWRIDVTQEPAKKWLEASQTADINKIDENLKDVFEHANDYQKDFTEAYLNYRKKITGCLVDFPKEKKLRAVDSLIKLFEQEQRTVLADFAPTLGGKLNNLKDELMNLKSENFTYTSVPLQMRQSMKDIIITFEPVGTANTGLSSYSLTVPIQLKKQPFVGFSSGFFYSGLTGDPYIVRDSVALLKRAGRTVSDSSAYYYRLSSENQGSGEWGVAALVHYGENICSSKTVHWHVSAGFGLTIQNKPQPRGLLGGGLAFGEKNKLVITIGGIVGYVQQLSEAYSADLSRIMYASPSSFTKSKLKGSVFFSITYNFLDL